MKLRTLKKSDLNRIDEIWRQHHSQYFSLPSLANTLTSAVIDDNGVIGCGLVKSFAEATMCLDLSLPKKDRLMALQMLMDEALRACNENKIEQLHVFIRDMALVKLLERKYGFRVIAETPMVLEV